MKEIQTVELSEPLFSIRKDVRSAEKKMLEIIVGFTAFNLNENIHKKK